MQAVDSLQNGDEANARVALEKAVVTDPSNELAKKLLDQIKADARFADSPLVRMGRLSVVPLTDQQYAAILELAGM